jgi:hypothetical protein
MPRDSGEDRLRLRSVWAGIYFRAADEQSAHLAKLVAKWRKHRYFKALH